MSRVRYVKPAASTATASSNATSTNNKQKKRPAAGAGEDEVADHVPAKRVRTAAADGVKVKAKSLPRANTSAKIKRQPAAPGEKKEEPVIGTVPAGKLQVYVFGEGSAGELGLGSKNATEVTVPRPNPNLAGVVSVACGGMHAAAFSADNKLLTWGVNDHKSLGRDTNWDGGLRDADANEDSDSEDGDLNHYEATPTAIPSDSLPQDAKIVQVAAGDSATFILTGTGYVYGCGTFRDMNGIFGFSYDVRTRQTVQVQASFTLIPELKKVKSICAGADFVLALDVDGHVFAWGVGQQHQLGRRIIERRRIESLVPARVELPKRRKMVSIHTGIDHAFAVDDDGDTWAWGLNNFAQTGISNNAGEGEASIAAPRKVVALAGKQMVMISGGRHHSVGVTSKGECLVWGRMDGFQLGLDLTQLPIQDPDRVLTDDRGRPRILLQPTALPIPTCVFATAGTDHCIAIDSEGKAWSWGFNVNYQCGQGSSDDIETAKPIEKKSVRDQKFCWAGAGGQYSMLAAYSSPKEGVNGSA